MSSEPGSSGSVVSLWRYPIKSMLGEELNSAAITERGLRGDRAYALIDVSSGRVVSAKNPLKWARMFDCRAAYTDNPNTTGAVRISLPDGTEVTSNSDSVNQVLSNVFDREVRLQSVAPEASSFEGYWPDTDELPYRNVVTEESLAPGMFFDGATMHILTTATLDRLRKLYPDGRFEARRFRPNIVVMPPSRQSGFVENTWVGRTLAIGDDVRLYITRACPRCVMTTMAQGDLPKDPGILRAAAKHNELNVGVYARISHPCTVKRGDTVVLE
jgi:uncharacterized protein